MIKDFAGAMDILFSVYNIPDSEKLVKARVYKQALAGVPIGALDYAVTEYVKVGKYFPRPAELLEIIEARRNNGGQIGDTVFCCFVPLTNDLIDLQERAAQGAYNRADWDQLIATYQRAGCASLAAAAERVSNGYGKSE